MECAADVAFVEYIQVMTVMGIPPGFVYTQVSINFMTKSPDCSLNVHKCLQMSRKCIIVKDTSGTERQTDSPTNKVTKNEAKSAYNRGEQQFFSELFLRLKKTKDNRTSWRRTTMRLNE